MEKSVKSLSVILPAYNEVESLEETISLSLATVTFLAHDYELIVARGVTHYGEAATITNICEKAVFVERCFHNSTGPILEPVWLAGMWN